MLSNNRKDAILHTFSKPTVVVVGISTKSSGILKDLIRSFTDKPKTEKEKKLEHAWIIQPSDQILKHCIKDLHTITVSGSRMWTWTCN